MQHFGNLHVETACSHTKGAMGPVEMNTCSQLILNCTGLIIPSGRIDVLTGSSIFNPQTPSPESGSSIRYNTDGKREATYNIDFGQLNLGHDRLQAVGVSTQ